MANKDTPPIWKCPHCMMEVDKKATRCPHCHGSIKRGTGIVTLTVAVLAVVFIGTYIIGQVNPPEQIPVEPPLGASMVFDVPSLIGLNITQIEQKLGKASVYLEPTELQLQMGIAEWEKSFEKDGRSLLVTYNYNTGKVVDFFINPQTSSGITNDTDGLLVLGSLKRDDSRYTVKFVPAISGGGFTGVIVSPR